MHNVPGKSEESTKKEFNFGFDYMDLTGQLW